MESSIRHLLNEDLKWIFVGGKGGVGKTTTSCALGMILSKYRESVLIISTDPAHNLADSLDQALSGSPTLVNGFTNLYAMEIEAEEALAPSIDSESDHTSRIFKDLVGTLPGIDEAVSFSKITQLAEDMKYSLTIFDTAPTGHALKLLSVPISLSRVFSNFGRFKETVYPLLSQFSALVGQEHLIFELLKKVETSIPIVEKVGQQMKDSKTTTFVCVCIAEFLSMYETERLLMELQKLQINVSTVVINQLIKSNPDCNLCNSISECQDTYLKEIEDLYSYLHVIKAYRFPKEVRGQEALKKYSHFLLP